MQLTAARCNTHAHAFTVWTRANTHSHARTHTRLLHTSTHSHIHTRTYIYSVDTCRPAISLPRLLLLPTNSLPRLFSTTPTTTTLVYRNTLIVYRAYYFYPRLLLEPATSTFTRWTDNILPCLLLLESLLPIAPLCLTFALSPPPSLSLSLSLPPPLLSPASLSLSLSTLSLSLLSIKMVIDSRL